jgi:hypothetical protein
MFFCECICQKNGKLIADFDSKYIFLVVRDPLCLSSSLTRHFSNYFFCVNHPVNRDDQQLLAQAIASDFTVAWQFSQREQFFYGSNSTPTQNTSYSNKPYQNIAFQECC